MSTLHKEIGFRITQLRLDHEMTQAQLAEKLDISIKHCSEVERGLSGLSIEKLIDLCSILSTNLDYIVRGISPYEDQTADIPYSVIELFRTKDITKRELLREYFLMFNKIYDAK